MKKPSALIQLLDDLKDTVTDTSVVSIDDSEASVYLDKDRIRFNQQECELLFHSANTVEQFFAALDEPDAAIELRDLIVEPEVMAALERVFAVVDDL